jgi:hypothetical protein
MSVSRRTLCQVYGLIAVLALVGTWANNLAYVRLGFVGLFLTTFWQKTLVNPASRSITVDIFFLGLSVFVWMILEARRLGMRFVWLYLLVSMTVAASVAVPVFMINRERALASRDANPIAGTLSRSDVAGLIAVAIAMVAYTVVTLLYGRS